MTQYGISNRARMSSPDVDPPMKRWANGLPFAYIGAKIRTTQVQTINTGVVTPVLFDTLISDTGSFIPTGMSGAATIDRITVPAQAGGLYIVTAGPRWLDSVPAARVTLRARIDFINLQGTVTNICTEGLTPTGTAHIQRSMSEWQYARPGEAFQLSLFHSEAGNITSSAGSCQTFGISRVAL